MRADVVETRIDASMLAADVRMAAAGAVVTFEGGVRDHDHGARVRRLDYVSHPSAGDVIAQVAADTVARFPVDAVAVSHRIGHLGIGDVALAAAVSGAHRQEAFEAAGWMVDEVKRVLPIWKHQFFADGTDEWVNCP